MEWGHERLLHRSRQRCALASSADPDATPLACCHQLSVIIMATANVQDIELRQRATGKGGCRVVSRYL
eukprot:1561851-Prymnesium_polylepis.1